MRASARGLLVPFFTPLVWCGRGIRTHDLPLRKRTLYQLSNRGGSRPRALISTLDKQRICVNTQLKSSKKQLKLNVCVPKSNSNDRYAITCDVIAYHLVHFVSIRLINKCQSGIDFIFTSERAIYSSFIKISVPSPVLRGKTLRWKWNFAKFTRSNVNKGMRFASVTINPRVWYFRKADDGSE